MLRILPVIFLMLSLSGCATMVVPDVSVTQLDHCATPAGLYLRFNTLTIALGPRPTAAKIELLALEQKGEQFIVRYREVLAPQQTGRAASSFCMQLKLPANWQELIVIDTGSGKTRLFTPQDNLSSQVSF